MKTKLEQSKIALKDLYEKYKERGLISLYIWGSILTDDFNFDTSDIDTIAIVENKFPLELEVEMMDYVRNKYPELGDFYIRLLYLSELNGGEAKAPLAKVIYPNLLLLEMPNWLYVLGKNYTNQDFEVKPANYKEAIATHLSKIKNDGWDNVERIPEDMHAFFVKTLSRLIDIVQRSRGEKDTFSYGKIFKASTTSGTQEEKEVTTAIMESRKNGWDYKVFLKNKEVFQKFIDFLFSTQGH